MLILSLLLATTGNLGTEKPVLGALRGTIYALPENTEKMPASFKKLKALGVIFTTTLDVPPRSFEEGFPGVTDRFEWFGIVYSGAFSVEAAGEYTFRVMSDDGSIVWIDNQQLIDNDGVHGSQDKAAAVKLSAGSHALKVWYFQGPATEISLQLFVTPPGKEEAIFDMTHFGTAAAAAAEETAAVATKAGVQVQLDAAVLFDSNKSVMKAGSQPALDKVVALLAAYPGAKIVITGHTDSEGPDAANLKLSKARAETIKGILAKDAPGHAYEANGRGETAPIAKNDTPENRAKNRRVEILIVAE